VSAWAFPSPTGYPTMKNTSLTLLLCLVSLSSFAKVNTVKISDGKSAYCKTKKDLYRNRIGAYNARATEIQLIDEETIKVDIKLKFLTCEKSGDAFNFSLTKPYHTLTYPSLNRASGQRVPVTVTPHEVRFKAFKDGVYKKLTDQLVDNQASQVVSIYLQLSDVMNQQQLEQLEEKVSTNASFDIWTSKLLNYEEETSGIEFKKLVNFGSYRIHFNIKYIQNEKTVTIIK
jgi:hypothetical protein